jgi:hypothetical protein
MIIDALGNVGRNTVLKFKASLARNDCAFTTAERACGNYGEKALAIGIKRYPMPT